MIVVLLRLAALALAIVGGAAALHSYSTTSGAGSFAGPSVAHTATGPGHAAPGHVTRAVPVVSVPDEREAEMAALDLLEQMPDMIIVPAATIPSARLRGDGQGASRWKRAFGTTSAPEGAKKKAKPRKRPRTKVACPWRCQFIRYTERRAWMRRAFEGA